VLLGYPTALDAILARAGTDTLQSIATASKGDPKQVMEDLARRNLIRPTTTQGHMGAVLSDKIVYDAQTTSGGSGGPLFNNEGKVIGINFAVPREFGGSNFAIPVSYGRSLLRPEAVAARNRLLSPDHLLSDDPPQHVSRLRSARIFDLSESIAGSQNSTRTESGLCCAGYL